MKKEIADLISVWERKNIKGIYCADKKEALQKLLELMPVTASVGISGSVTLNELGIVKLLEERGNKVFNQNKAGLAKEEGLELRKLGASADCYLVSANAVSLEGELIFLSAWGHRIAGIANAKNVIVIAGTNKLVKDRSEGLKRAKDYAMPLNYKRLNWDPARVMCCQELIIDAEASAGRLTVVLVEEKLGF
ncbi:MAG: hypothetical protein FJZ15_01525 [Candidatus Omnitrophica bacterium]|nr:hypothetical protein [Candidatus Omnitrophota bacterium]